MRRSPWRALAEAWRQLREALATARVNWIARRDEWRERPPSVVVDDIRERW